MKFALVDGEKLEPQPKLAGTCPGCGEPVTAKCGQQKVWHWAHKGRLICDPWWEPETLWHRSWKNKFPVDWQEIPQRSPDTNELHIADVRTPNGLVMEFQHSSIAPAERASRETFYGNMLWVVDCTRLKSDRPRIDDRLPQWRDLPEGIVREIGNPAALFPSRWVNCDVPVLFDFNGLETDNEEAKGDHLLCLMPKRYGDAALYFPVARQTLVLVGNGELTIFDWQDLHRRMLERDRQELLQLQKSFRRRMVMPRRGRRR